MSHNIKSNNMNILFVCSANEDRSPTAERLYANHPEHPGLKVKSAGTSDYARARLSKTVLQWADVIICMERQHQRFIEDKYSDIVANKVIDHLNIWDIYPYMHPNLQKEIREKMDAWLREYQQNQ